MAVNATTDMALGAGGDRIAGLVHVVDVDAIPALRLRGGERDAGQGVQRGARRGDEGAAAAWR